MTHSASAQIAKKITEDPLMSIAIVLHNVSGELLKVMMTRYTNCFASGVFESFLKGKVF